MRADVLLACVSGALLALSFPRFGHPACAWVALVPLLLALSGWRGRGPLRGQPPLRGFGLGLVSGVIYFIGTVYWTGGVLATFGGLAPPLAVLAVVLLALYLALYPALGAAAIGTLVARGGRSALFLAPAVWVTAEYLRGVLFTGFPWVPLGNSQVEVLPVAQLASVLGVYGVSLFVAGVNAVLAFCLITDGRARAWALSAGVVALAAVGTWGALRVADAPLTRAGTPLRVGLIQGNVEQEEKWDPRDARRIFTTYIAMTRDAVRRGAQYVVWPESSTPFMFEENPEGEAAIRNLAAEVQVPMLFGSDQVERGEQPRLYNAAFQLAADGRTAAVYRKVQLVPFGEFIPLQHWISFVAPLVGGMAPFAAGSGVVLLPVGSHLASTAICYEVVFPNLAREAVEAGSELLTTITNDAWYGRTSAPYQHFALASMRAIEQGRYLARAANTGISGVVDPYGRVVAKSAIFEQVGVVADVRFLTERTIYSRFGDVAAFASMALTAVALVTLRGPK